jgi:hypothetical protein
MNDVAKGIDEIPGAFMQDHCSQCYGKDCQLNNLADKLPSDGNHCRGKVVVLLSSKPITESSFRKFYIVVG